MTQEKLKTKSLTLFFTYRISLEKWAKTGLLDREIKLYNELAKRFKKIYFITYGGEKELEYKQFLAKNIEVLFNRWGINNLVYSFLIPFLHRKILKNVWVFKTNQMLGSWAAVISKIIFKKKLIIRHGYQLSLFVKGWALKKYLAQIIERFAYKKADVVIATTKVDKKFISDKYGLSLKKIKVFSNFIETDFFKPLPVKKNPKRLIFVGRFIERKNIFSLLEAVKKLNAELVLIGDGPLKEKIKQKIRNERIKNVKLLGILPKDQIPRELNKSQIFIIPSFFEGNPKVLLEAMACGLAIIGTKVMGIKEIIKHKENGYLCQLDSNSLRQAITDLFRNPALMKKIGTQARNYTESQCSLDPIVQKELKLYESL